MLIQQQQIHKSQVFGDTDDESALILGKQLSHIN